MANETNPSSRSQNSSEPLSLLRILASAFAGVLFGWFFSRSLEQRNEPRHPQNSPANPESRPTPLMPLNVQAAHAEPEQNRSQARKDGAPLRKKISDWVVSIGTLGLLVVNIFLLSSTKKAANAAQRSADITKKTLDYTYDFVYSHQYASKVWVRMPRESFRIEPGKPISESIEIINYGAVPALVRARIYIEAGPRVIERLADDTAANKPPLGKEAEALPDVRDTRQIILGPNEGTGKFFPEPSKILTEEDYRSVISGLAAGTTQVVVYGRIDYSDASGPWKGRHNSIFCFYALKDKSPSACPNYEGKYTVWAR